MLTNSLQLLPPCVAGVEFGRWAASYAPLRFELTVPILVDKIIINEI
jgi:hypothetical protein